MTDSILAILCGATAGLAFTMLRILLWQRRQARWGFQYQRKNGQTR